MAENVYCEIEIDYYDYNASVGGIVGKQFSNGVVRDCTFSGRISLWGYYSDKYDKLHENTEFQLYVGIIVGYNVNGKVLNCTWSNEVPIVTSLRAMNSTQSLYFKNEVYGKNEI